MFKKALLISTMALSLAACKKNIMEEPTLGAPDGQAVAGDNMQLLAIASNSSFKVMSFNIRHNDAADPQTITQRAPLIKQIIIDNTPDIVGLQEYSDQSFENSFNIEMANLGYGKYYDQALTGSPKVIFYKTSRFTLNSSGTSNIGGTNTATWAILTDNTNSKKYFVSNSHWQFDSQPMRETNAANLANMVNTKNTENLPEIVFGDFNAQPGAPEIGILKDGLDVVDALGDSEGDLTFHGWSATGTKKLDWMMSNRDMAFLSWKVVNTSYSGNWPSDHWPVMATYVPAILGGAHADANGLSAVASTNFSFGDINGDGRADKIFWRNSYSSGQPLVYLSNGNGTFASPGIAHTAGASTLSSTKYYYADVNGDGKDDEILWDPTLNSGKTMVYLATTNGNFSGTAINNTQGTSGSAATSFYFADVNGDGKADKIYWNNTFDSGNTRVYLATSGGAFSNTVVSDPVGASTTAGTTFYFKDVNGDGRADKILWHPSLNSGKTMVYLSDGDGTFTASSSFSNSGATSTVSSTTFYFTDINGDGRADKVYWRPDAYLGKLKFYLSDTDNTFDGPIYSLRGTSQSANTQFFFADINGDGKEDQIRWNYGEYSGELRNYFGK
ncbi:MAG: FG-GAP-like repeat-containing protein [Pedobacter sp.]|nr:FG-GAP-like repeat-containing protein [Pedobacter sp.]MDQ8054336.1 FG-GAP-like repeat-containing protein [Pedobacter sp.]